MSYELAFNDSALKEWKALDDSVKTQFKKKLIQRLEQPHVIADRLRGLPCCYKIKLRSAGFRLVYQVIDKQLTVTVIAVGKREQAKAYKAAEKRI